MVAINLLMVAFFLLSNSLCNCWQTLVRYQWSVVMIVSHFFLGDVTVDENTMYLLRKSKFWNRVDMLIFIHLTGCINLSNSLVSLVYPLTVLVLELNEKKCWNWCSSSCFSLRQLWTHSFGCISVFRNYSLFVAVGLFFMKLRMSSVMVQWYRLWI